MVACIVAPLVATAVAFRATPYIHPTGLRLPFYRVIGQIWREGLGLMLQGVGLSGLTAFASLYFAARGWGHAGLVMTAFGSGYIFVRVAWQLSRVLDHIEAHLAEEVTVKTLADLIQVSRGHLSRAFKVSVGVSPCHYIGTRRVELACTMMQTTRESLCQIAVACGLCDQSHLCKLFHRTTGMTPSAWRRMIRARDAAASIGLAPG